MVRKRLWNHNPAQSRIHEFQEMTLNFALLWKSIRIFMIDGANIPDTKMFQKRLQVIVMLQMKASEAWQAILPEMSLRIYPRLKLHWTSTSLDFSELYCKEGMLESYPREKKVQDIPQPWTRLLGCGLNFKFQLLSAFIVPAHCHVTTPVWNFVDFKFSPEKNALKSPEKNALKSPEFLEKG